MRPRTGMRRTKFLVLCPTARIDLHKIEMTLNLQNISESISKLNKAEVKTFQAGSNGFPQFLLRIKVNEFRHIKDVGIDFEHPVTVISGTNRTGKTSLLLLIACSHEDFWRLDASAPKPYLRKQGWSDVLSFTSHETINKDYSYELSWRKGTKTLSGEGKRLASSAAWSGLGKKSKDLNRTNSKIRERQVVLSDLERTLPGRSFSRTLIRKANNGIKTPLSDEVCQAFAYIFSIPSVKISEIGSHINKSCFFIENSTTSYSTYNSATGEESLVYLLKDIIDSPEKSLLLIDEIEAGFHPTVQRKICDVIQYLSWRDKKQFILTSHSPTIISSFHPRSRKFIETNPDGTYRTISGISEQAALSKMDSTAHPLLRLYCEDDLANFLISQTLTDISQEYRYFQRLINIVESGPASAVKTDYERHKHNYTWIRGKIGYCAVLDGDMKDKSDFSSYFGNAAERVHFLFPYEPPEKFLVRAYLSKYPNANIESALEHTNHHTLFNAMVTEGLATDTMDARNRCHGAFLGTAEHKKQHDELRSFLLAQATYFSEVTD